MDALKALSSISTLVVTGLWSAILPTKAQVNVQYHNHASRDGFYIDPAFTQSAAANLARDLNFDRTISGDVCAQPLYIEGGSGGRALVIGVTWLEHQLCHPCRKTALISMIVIVGWFA